jgi:hypothetical protein
MEKLSATLHGRIRETEAEIASLERRLTTLLSEKQVALSAATVDTKALQRIEAEESRIPMSLDSLRTRCTLLSNQIQNALKSEASDRVVEIEREQQELARRINARGEAWRAHIADLLALVKQDYPDRQRLGELKGEARFLQTSYDAPHAHVPPVVPLGQKDLVKVEAALRESHWLTHASKWSEQADELMQLRARAERAELDTKKTPVTMRVPATSS